MTPRGARPAQGTFRLAGTFLQGGQYTSMERQARNRSMRANTRYVLLGGGGVLVVGFLVAGVAYLQGGFPALAVTQSGPAELQYVPAEASLIAYANVRDVMQSSFRQRIREIQPDLDGQREFQEETGIDLENDVDHIVASLVQTGAERPSGLVLLTGRFDEPSLESLAREHGGSAEQYGGHTLLSRALGDDQTELAMSFVDVGVLALGSADMVRRAIDVSSPGAGDTDVTSNERLMGLMTHVRGSHNAWAIAEFDGTDGFSFLPDEVESQIPPLTAMAVGGRVNGGVSATVTVETRDEQAGQDLRDVVQGLVALGRMRASSEPGLRALLDTVQLSSSGRAVTLSFDMPSEILDLVFSTRDDEP